MEDALVYHLYNEKYDMQNILVRLLWTNMLYEQPYFAVFHLQIDSCYDPFNSIQICMSTSFKIYNSERQRNQCSVTILGR